MHSPPNVPVANPSGGNPSPASVEFMVSGRYEGEMSANPPVLRQIRAFTDEVDTAGTTRAQKLWERVRAQDRKVEKPEPTTEPIRVPTEE